MKKYGIFICLVAILTLTGCGNSVSSDNMSIEKREFDNITNVKQKNSDYEVVSCSMTQEESSVTMDQTITLNFKSNVLKSADIVIDAVLDDDLLDYIDTFVESLKTEFEDFEYGDDVRIKKTSTGARITYTMDEDDFEQQYGSASTKNAIIREIEASGYICD